MPQTTPPTSARRTAGCEGWILKGSGISQIMGRRGAILGWLNAPIIVSVTVLDADLFSSRCPPGFAGAGDGVPSRGIALATGAGIACCSAMVEALCSGPQSQKDAFRVLVHTRQPNQQICQGPA